MTKSVCRNCWSEVRPADRQCPNCQEPLNASTMISLVTLPTMVERSEPPVSRTEPAEHAHIPVRPHDTRPLPDDKRLPPSNEGAASSRSAGTDLERPSEGFDPMDDRKLNGGALDKSEKPDSSRAERGPAESKVTQEAHPNGRADDSLSLPCPACRARVDRHRRFCDSCFTEMQQSSIPTAPSKFVKRRSSRGPSRQTVAWLAAAGLLGFTLVALMLSSPGEALRSSVFPASDPVDYTIALYGSASLLDGDLERLGDGDDGRGAALDWTSSLAAESCRTGSAPGFTIDFDPVQAPRELRIVGGIKPADSAEAPQLWPGPRRMSVVTGDGEWCGELDFGGEPGEQRLTLPDSVPTGQLTLLIHDRWETGGAQVYPVIAIGEIELLR